MHIDSVKTLMIYYASSFIWSLIYFHNSDLILVETVNFIRYIFLKLDFVLMQTFYIIFNAKLV